MNTSKLRHKLAFYDFSLNKNEYNEIEKKEVFAFYEWCEIQPLQGNEKFLNNKIQTSISHKIRLRYNRRVNPTQIIKYGERIFEIISVISPYEQLKELVLMCEEVKEVE